MKPKASQPKNVAKKVVQSDSEDMEDQQLPPGVGQSTALGRTARTAPKKYIEVDSDEGASKVDTFEVSD